MVKVIAGLALALFATVEASAAFVSGNELLARMGDQERVSRYTFMQGYVAGVADAFQEGLCIPEQVTVGQLVDVSKRWLESHPERRHQEASLLLMYAYQEAWPCRKK